MTIVGRTFDGLKAELEVRGYEIVCSDFFLEHNRIVCKRGDHNFVLQFMKFYNYRFIFKLFTDLGLTPPEDCIHVVEQESIYKKK